MAKKLAKKERLEEAVIFRIKASDKKKLTEIANERYRRELPDFMRVVSEDIISGKIKV